MEVRAELVGEGLDTLHKPRVAPLSAAEVGQVREEEVEVVGGRRRRYLFLELALHKDQHLLCFLVLREEKMEQEEADSVARQQQAVPGVLWSFHSDYPFKSFSPKNYARKLPVKKRSFKLVEAILVDCASSINSARILLASWKFCLIN